MRNHLSILAAGIGLAVNAVATSCIVSGYEDKLLRPLVGTYAEKTIDLTGPFEGPVRTSSVTSAGPFDSLVWLSVDTEPGPLCSLPLGFLLMFR